jgi:hypothetical protein
VLKQFGRADNDYAQSAEKNIALKTSTHPHMIKVDTKKKTGVLGQPKSQSSINLKALAQIAKDSTNFHTASISDNGKYISFRHAGGNYLQDYAAIYNVVGRFVRAMIIAADPTAYAQEYQTKLAKLAGTSQPSAPKDPITVLSSIRTNGLPVIQVQAMRFSSSRSGKNIARDALLGYTHDDRNFIIQPGGEAARQAILSKVQDQRRKGVVQQEPVASFFNIIAVPQTAKDITTYAKFSLHTGAVRIDQHDGYEDTGFAVYNKVNLPLTDPMAQAVLKKLMAEYYKKKAKKR